VERKKKRDSKPLKKEEEGNEKGEREEDFRGNSSRRADSHS